MKHYQKMGSPRKQIFRGMSSPRHVIVKDTEAAPLPITGSKGDIEYTAYWQKPDPLILPKPETDPRWQPPFR